MLKCRYFQVKTFQKQTVGPGQFQDFRSCNKRSKCPDLPFCDDDEDDVGGGGELV